MSIPRPRSRTRGLGYIHPRLRSGPLYLRYIHPRLRSGPLYLRCGTPRLRSGPLYLRCGTRIQSRLRYRVSDMSIQRPRSRTRGLRYIVRVSLRSARRSLSCLSIFVMSFARCHVFRYLLCLSIVAMSFNLCLSIYVLVVSV
jgi:hypothetical protein